MIRRICKTAPLAALLLGSTCFGYIRFLTNFVGDTSPVPLFRIDNSAIQFYLNSGVVAGAQSSISGSAVTVISANSNPVAAVRSALATWNAVGTINVAFLPLQTTNLVIDPTDGKMVIAIGSTASDVSFVGPALAVTVNSYLGSTGVLDGVNGTKGTIVDSDIILNPAPTVAGVSTAFSTDGSTQIDLQSVVLHELGHSLGANHSGLLGASMFQSPTQRFLSADDLTFAETAYPLANPVALGTISGTVTVGGIGLPYALLTGFDTSAGVTIGGITNADGTYFFNVPPGNYQVYAEPLNGVDTINIYLTAAQVALAGATKFQTTMANGSYPVTANGTATVNIAVTPGAAGLATPYAAAGPVGSLPSALYKGAAVTVPSGGSVDLMLAGTGFDSTLSASNFAFYGKGVTLQSVKLDKNATVGTFNLLRVTLNVLAATTPSLASFTATTTAGTVSFSGSLVIVPPTPATTSQSIISAASFAGNGAGNGAVSPGGEYALYPGKNASIGPVTGVSNPPNFDAYGNLPTVLGGVSVTFDGVPAPLFYVSAAQINLQVPFEVGGKTTTSMIVNYLGSPSPAVNVPVLPVQPALYTANFSGTGPVIAFHLKDGTLNTAQNPAAKGDYILLYGTGIGKVSYGILTGQAAPAPPGGFTGNYTFSIGGSASAPALYGGWAPNYAAFAQWDLQIPTSSASGQVPIIVTDTATGASSQTGATLFVK